MLKTVLGILSVHNEIGKIKREKKQLCLRQSLEVWRSKQENVTSEQKHPRVYLTRGPELPSDAAGQ